MTGRCDRRRHQKLLRLLSTWPPLAAYYEEDITRNYPARCQSVNLAWLITLILVRSLTKFVFFKYLFSHDSFAKLTLTLTLIDTINAPKTSSCFCIHSAQLDILTCLWLYPRTLLFILQNKSSCCVGKFSCPSQISQFMLFCPQLRPSHNWLPVKALVLQIYS